MADGGRQDVLGQKAQAAQRAYEARGMSPSKALRRAMSRAADILWDLALVGQDVHQEVLDQDGVIAALESDNLLILLDGPDGAVGLVEVDRAVMTGIVEVQTIQQVTNMPVEDRPLTPTDAAMVAPLLDNTFERFVSYLEDNPLRAQVEGFSFGAMLEDPRGASLLLDAASYRAFRVKVDLALGRRHGVVSFFLPVRKTREATDDSMDKAGPHEAEMLRVPTRLDCVLAKVSIPLSRAERLRPGDLLELSGQALTEAELRSVRGEVVARGRLGQMNGMRALRITWPKLGAAVPAIGMSLPTPPAEELEAFGIAPEAETDFGANDFGSDFGSDFGDSVEAETVADTPSESFDFAADAAAFNMDEFGSDFGSDAEPSGEDAFAAEAGLTPAPDGEDAFASAPMDFDFEN